MNRLFLAVPAALLAIAAPAVAHHSFAMFDRAKEVTLKGEVKSFQWSNPHCWVDLIVIKDGKPATYAIEAGSPNVLSRRGWKRDIFKVGDQVTIVINPLVSGEAGGSFVRATLPNGTSLTGS